MKRKIEDNTGIIRAEIEITSVSDNLFSGTIIKHNFSDEQIKLFKEYENLVNNQVLSLLDEIENKIESFGFKLNEDMIAIFDLQIWNLKELSFRKKSTKI